MTVFRPNTFEWLSNLVGVQRDNQWIFLVLIIIEFPRQDPLGLALVFALIRKSLFRATQGRVFSTAPGVAMCAFNNMFLVQLRERGRSAVSFQYVTGSEYEIFCFQYSSKPLAARSLSQLSEVFLVQIRERMALSCGFLFYYQEHGVLVFF